MGGAIDRHKPPGHDAKDQQEKQPIDVDEHATIDHRKRDISFLLGCCGWRDKIRVFYGLPNDGTLRHGRRLRRSCWWQLQAVFHDLASDRGIRRAASPTMFAEDDEGELWVLNRRKSDEPA